MFDDSDDRVCFVVVVDEQQYSIWPQNRWIPDGLRTNGLGGSNWDA